MSSYDPNAFVAPPPGGGNRGVNVPGRIALIAGVALVLVQVTRVLVLFPMNGSMWNWQAVNMAFTVGEALLALAAIVLGAIGLGGRRDRPRGSAAAGLALGVATLLLTIVNVLVPVLTRG